MIFLRTVCCLFALTLASSAIAEEKPLTPAKKRPPAKTTPVVSEPQDMQESELHAQAAYQIILGEIALQRGDPVLASQLYSDLAKRSGDIKVLERAADIAIYAKQYDKAEEMATRLLQEDPTAKRGQQLYIGIRIMQNKLDGLSAPLITLLQSSPDTLGENLLGLNRMFVRSQDRNAVYRLMREVCAVFPDKAEAHYALALAAYSANANQQALNSVQKALELRPEWEQAALLESQLLVRDNPEEALNRMRAYLKRYPQAREIELQLARTLAVTRQFSEARQHLLQLLEAYPNSPDVLYPAALVALQQNDKALSERYFRHIVSLDNADKNLAYYYLGQIAEDDKRIDEAIGFYQQIKMGENFIAAQVRRAQLLAAQGKLSEARANLHALKVQSPEEKIRIAIAEAGLVRDAGNAQEAFNLLDALWQKNQDNPDLLYESALIAERLGRMDITEKRLRRLIALQPNSAMAYNALGYSFADHNIHLKEARTLIEKALQLAPEDDAILDSMGWVLFRQGDAAAALPYLERSYARRDDPEVALHLAEVLWQLGRHDEAHKIIVKALQKNPGNSSLSDALRKFTP